MLHPSGSYPRACPYWMHAPPAESLSGISPLATNASLFNRGRHCSTLYDYGFSKLMFITTANHFFVDIIKLMMICSVKNAPFPIIDLIGTVK